MTEIQNTHVVPVHVVSSSVKQDVTPEKEIVSAFNSYPLSTGTLPVQILGHTPKRKRAVVIVNGSGIVVFGKTQSDCESALGNAVNEITGNVATVYGATTSAYPLVVKNTSELWAALYSATTPDDATVVPTIISVIRETEQ